MAVFWAFMVVGLFLQHTPRGKGSEHGLGSPGPQGRSVAGEGPWERTWVTAGLQSSFCTLTHSAAHLSSCSLLQGSPSPSRGWESLGMP